MTTLTKAQRNYDSQVPSSYWEDDIAEEANYINTYSEDENTIREIYCIEEQECSDFDECKRECDTCPGLKNILDIIGID